MRERLCLWSVRNLIKTLSLSKSLCHSWYFHINMSPVVFADGSTVPVKIQKNIRGRSKFLISEPWRDTDNLHINGQWDSKEMPWPIMSHSGFLFQPLNNFGASQGPKAVCTEPRREKRYKREIRLKFLTLSSELSKFLSWEITLSQDILFEF